MESKRFGYVRVSSKDQNEARQVREMLDLGIDERDIRIDKQSGKDFDREGYRILVDHDLREGDTLYVHSLDRFGRNYNEILEQWRVLTKEKKVNIVVLDMPLLNTTENRDLTGVLISDIVLQLLSYVAQKERENIRQRQAEGIALAKERGVYRGRVPIEVDRGEFAKLYEEVLAGDRTAVSAMRKMNLKTNTFYRMAREYRMNKEAWLNGTARRTILDEMENGGEE